MSIGGGSPQQGEENKLKVRATVSIERVVRFKTARNGLKDYYGVGAGRAIAQVRKHDPEFPLNKGAATGVRTRVGDALEVIIASHG